MRSRRVTYLFILLLVVGSLTVYHSIAIARLGEGKFADSSLLLFVSCVGPLMAIAIAGQTAFRQLYWSLWFLTAYASAYSGLIILGLITEQSMAQAVVEAEARGSRYMNCAGSLTVFFFILAIPLTVLGFLSAAFVAIVELSFRGLAGSWKYSKRA